MRFYQDILDNLFTSFVIYFKSALSSFHSNNLYFEAFPTVLCFISELQPMTCRFTTFIIHILSTLIEIMILTSMLGYICSLSHYTFTIVEHSHLLSSLSEAHSQESLFDVLLPYLLAFLF